ncbi:hypothetical protein LB518_02010 [Mesorhizobium sp. BR1-1-16]|uniref:hypothetical protein n=1 Tax=Mesorhizobium sp. BR1-1-16 TaxID=2876653 RepID=UPI001CCCE317|nr:hypothetical protein [Mesorhizobium sp. BR1-1-16]MBZ9935055.1 hypothetical protein [Mesorhizobium sp. BR1-1-16]
MIRSATMPIAAAFASALALMAASTGSAQAFSYYDGHTAPVPDWEVFGFDLTSVPGDVASLMAFKASLDPRLQVAINNRCKQDIVSMPWRYSPKVRMFCWGH